jgi:hypothetical protein
LSCVVWHFFVKKSTEKSEYETLVLVETEE